jgi:hypothetical protein
VPLLAERCHDAIHDGLVALGTPASKNNAKTMQKQCENNNANNDTNNDTIQMQWETSKDKKQTIQYKYICEQT